MYVCAQNNKPRYLSRTPCCSLPACNYLAIDIRHRALPLSRPILELAHVASAITQNLSAVAVRQVILPFPEIIENVGFIILASRVQSSATPFATSKMANVFGVFPASVPQ
jgi:hypothetical protein